MLYLIVSAISLAAVTVLWGFIEVYWARIVVVALVMWAIASIFS